MLSLSALVARIATTARNGLPGGCSPQILLAREEISLPCVCGRHNFGADLVLLRDLHVLSGCNPAQDLRSLLRPLLNSDDFRAQHGNAYSIEFPGYSRFIHTSS